MSNVIIEASRLITWSLENLVPSSDLTREKVVTMFKNIEIAITMVEEIERKIDVDNPVSHHVQSLIRRVRSAVSFLDKTYTAAQDVVEEYEFAYLDEQVSLVATACLIQESPFSLPKKIGEGGNGKVYSTTLEPDCPLVHKVAASLGREIEFLMRCNHPHILKIVGVKGNGILMPREIQDLEKAISTMTPQKLQTYIKQLLEAIAYIHERGIVHYDIKPANILIGNKGVKLADFGCARSSDEGNLRKSGTQLFASPQMFKDDTPLSTSDDMWSLGATLFEVLSLDGGVYKNTANDDEFFSAVEAFDTQTEMRRVHLSPVLDWFDPDWELYAMIESLLDGDPEKRPTAKELLDHPYLRKDLTQIQDETVHPLLNQMSELIRTAHARQGPNSVALVLPKIRKSVQQVRADSPLFLIASNFFRALTKVTQNEEESD